MARIRVDSSGSGPLVKWNQGQYDGLKRTRHGHNLHTFTTFVGDQGDLLPREKGAF